jgi:peptidoglycan/xylan/chitin deacetylase (PgdA/CDA1 family)
MKIKRLAALLVSLSLMIGMIVVVGSGPADALEANRRGIGFIRMYSASPGANANWDGGVLQSTPGAFINIDITTPGLHTLRVPWPRTDTMWAIDHTGVFFLRPGNPHPDALEVSLESLSIAGDVKVSRQRLSSFGGSFWNGAGDTPLFGNIAVDTGVMLSGIPGFTMHRFGISDMSQAGTGPDHLAFGPSDTLGTIRQGDRVEITYRVGERPRPNYGDVNGDGGISAADVTLLRRYIAATDKAAFIEANGEFNIYNADANGDGRIDASDVTRIRRWLSLTTPGRWDMGPPRPKYYVSITIDDGPDNRFTGQMLDRFQALNNRPNVGCILYARPDFCAPPNIGCGILNCGKGEDVVSRVYASFYILGIHINEQHQYGAGRGYELMRRAVREGHSIEMHGERHQPPQSRTAAIELMRGQRAAINNALGDVTDNERGITYNALNPYVSFSYRPPTFATPGVNFADRDENVPWIFAGIDPDDWRGHTTAAMRTFIIDRPPNQRGCGAEWCNFATSSYGGAHDGGANGGFILIHDHGGNGRQPSVNLLGSSAEDLIPIMQAMEYHFVTVPEMYEFMDAEPMWMPAGGGRVNDWVRQGQRRPS